MIKKITWIYYEYKAIRYIIGGASAAFLDLVLLYISTDVFWLYYLYSQVIAFVFSFTYAYFFQKFLTFRDHTQNHLLQGGKFLLFAVLGLWGNLLIMYILVDSFHFHYLLSSLISKWIIFFRNYSMNKWFNFS